MIKTILGIIFFALTTMVIYSWGYVKQQRVPSQMMKKLNKKAEERIIKTLKTKESMTKKEITELISGIKVWDFGSRKKIIVNEPQKLAKPVLDNMINRDIINIDYSTNPKKYTLTSKLHNKSDIGISTNKECRRRRKTWNVLWRR